MVIWEEQAKMKKEGTQESYLKKRRLANKLRVCYYLVKYPNLLKERKKRKEKEVEKEEEEAKEEKEKIKENLNLPSKKAKKLKEITYEPNKEKKVEIEMSELDKN